MEGNRNVPLIALLDRLPDAGVQGDVRRVITSVAADSRHVVPGALFVALPGNRTDGHRYIDDAIARGACAIVVEEIAPPVRDGVAVVRVRDTRAALSALSSAFYGDPSKALDIAGVTGTNGKTTITHMIAAILNEAGTPCGILGTVGAQFIDLHWDLHNTTPLPPELHAVLAEMRGAGAKAVAMEVSSHALALQRVEDVHFCAAVLSNVTRDHLDFHETLDAYRAAKRRLFDMSQRCVLNHDDDSGAQWAAELAAQGRDVVTYGLQSGAMLQPRQTTFAAGGSRFTVDGRPFELRLPGRFNVSNALAAIAVARMHGIGDECSASALAALERVAGRMERIPGNGFDVVVDYAHTPDALANALGALRETTTGNVAVVFGCGGDRDRGKRPEMGAVAARLADRLYLTNDNPRTEEPSAILRDIRDGIRERNVPVIEEPDRRRAIERAISDARSGDVVLLAGKGHEDYQIIGECVHEFDDAKVARDALAHLPAR
jgi:UDP-N-acetylmuramoyl-L-alanyl-D-glutamate--2,6-diaminopimelate ligase